MPDVSLGPHLFDMTALDLAVKNIIPAVPNGHKNAIVAAVDLEGAKVALSMDSANGHWTARAAVEHDWTGDNRVAGDVMFSW